MRLLILCILAALLSGCAYGGRSPAQLESPEPVDPISADLALSGAPEGMARIIFYRPEEAFLVAVKPRIVVNGKSAGEITMGTAFYRDAQPGFYNVHLEHEEEQAVIFQARKGESVFLRTRLAWELFGHELRIKKVEPDTGAVEARILRWQLRQADDVPFTFRRDRSPVAVE